MDHDNFIRHLSHVVRQDRLKQALEAVTKYRRELGGHTINLSVSVMQPICINCVDSRLYEGIPDISADNWTMDLLLLGFHPDVISKMEEQITIGIDETVQGPFCYDCNRPLPYWIDEDSACCYVEVPFSQYVGHVPEPTAKSVSKSLKKVIIKAYGATCFGCERDLKRGEITIDHIVPKAQGGKADRFNLQPLCCSCNQEKDDKPPLEQELVLNFPLRPLPSDAYEGMVW